MTQPTMIKRRARRSNTAVALGWIVLTVLVLGLWSAAAHFSWINPIFIGNPLGVLGRFIEGITGPLLYSDALQTTAGAVIGWILAGVAAILFAFVVSLNKTLERILDPFITALNSLPRVALAPLFLLWFGIGMAPKVVLSFSLAFFVIFGGTMAGLRSVNNDHILIARSMGLDKFGVFRNVVLPSAVPSIFSGLELGFIFGILGTVSGEMISGSGGIGVYLTYAAAQFDMNGYFAGLAILVIITMVIAWALRVIRGKLLRWQRAGTVVD